MPARLELRKLKYELLKDREHRKFFPTNSPKTPAFEVYKSIFEDRRILPLCRYIGSAANYYENEFNTVDSKAKEINNYINEKYN